MLEVVISRPLDGSRSDLWVVIDKKTKDELAVFKYRIEAFDYCCKHGYKISNF